VLYGQLADTHQSRPKRLVSTGVRELPREYPRSVRSITNGVGGARRSTTVLSPPRAWVAPNWHPGLRFGECLHVAAGPCGAQ
jgi:hypothetical protein